MNIAQFSVKRPVAVTMWVAAVVLLGTICAFRLPVDLLPKVTRPTLSVSTQWPNVAPEALEIEITRRVEQAVSSVPNLYAVRSSTTEGQSNVTIEFQWGTDMGQAAVDVLQLVERAKQRFPNDDKLQMPIIRKFDPNQMPVLTLGVSGEPDEVRLRTLLDNEIGPMLESAEGVASASISGGIARAILVDIDPVRLAAHNLTLSEVTRRIVQENVNLPAGIAKQGDTELTIRSQGWLVSLDELRKLPITASNAQVVTLDQVADVRDEHQEQRVFSRLDGEPAASISISKQSEANTITTVQAVMARVERAKQSHPNLQFRVIYDQSRYIANSVSEVRNAALLGGALAILLLLFFLRNVRSTLVVAISIPISVIATFAMLYLAGFTINVMSLGGLALATGLIVDDAIVVLENIFRHIERDKKSAREAAVSGTNEVISAVIASTWTVMVVFLPLLLIRGQAGQMYTQFALVVIFSLGVSLFDAVTVVPMLATRIIKGDAHHETMEGVRHNWLERLFAGFGRAFDGLDQSYRVALGWSLKHRGLVVGGALTATLATLALMPFIGSELMPATDTGDLNVSIRMPVGTALSKTETVMRQVEDALRKNPNVETVFATTGGGRGGAQPHTGSASVRLKPHRTKKTEDIVKELNGQLGGIPGVRPRVTASDIIARVMTGGDTNMEINLFGNDLKELRGTADSIVARLAQEKIAGLENLDVSWQDATPELNWKMDRAKMAMLGLTFTDVANTINASTSGASAGYFQEKGFQYPIVVQLPPDQRKSVADLQRLALSSASGGARGMLLGQVATPREGQSASEITRVDRRRYIAITGTPNGRSISDIQADVQRVLSAEKALIPEGYDWDWGINTKRKAEEFAGMGVAVFLAIALIYMLLATQFESFIHPLTVLLSVPLAASGVILSLLLTHRAFGLTAFVGVLMLVGIVVKNGILLVDYTNTLRSRGTPRNDAVLRAGPTRLRPILMTASAAVLGMLPLALGFGEGSEIQAPMATVVIGGLVTSTLLTLFVVPVMYTLLDDAVGGGRRGPEVVDATAEVPAEVQG